MYKQRTTNFYKWQKGKTRCTCSNRIAVWERHSYLNSKVDYILHTQSEKWTLTTNTIHFLQHCGYRKASRGTGSGC